MTFHKFYLYSLQPSNPLSDKSSTCSSWKGTNNVIRVHLYCTIEWEFSITRPVVALHLILSKVQQSEVLLSTHETRMASTYCMSLTDFMKALISKRPILSLSKQLLGACIWTKVTVTHNENLIIKNLPIVIDFACMPVATSLFEVCHQTNL